ncbi:MAG: metallophosphoesterase [Verrucomicrobia bacterium]|nr:metallophosphoesterase [Verrucomicrobiota bacterium]
MSVTRIFSDLHYGDRASRIRALAAIRPLLEGVTALVLNGDTIDTRPGPSLELTRELQEETRKFFASTGVPTTFITGNHDPDISTHHTLDLADGQVFVTHGDIIFEELVPWGQDAPFVRRRIAEEIALLEPSARDALDPRLGAYRRVAASIPQRHQSERNALKYAVGFLKDTVWPPLRILHVLRAWKRAPGLAAALARRHRPSADFIVIGHIHRPGFWLTPNGVVVINTGSFTPPLGGWLVDVLTDRLQVRSIVSRRGKFHAGPVVKEFPLRRA